MRLALKLIFIILFVPALAYSTKITKDDLTYEKLKSMSWNELFGLKLNQKLKVSEEKRALINLLEWRAKCADTYKKRVENHAENLKNFPKSSFNYTEPLKNLKSYAECLEGFFDERERELEIDIKCNKDLKCHKKEFLKNMKKICKKMQNIR